MGICLTADWKCQVSKTSDGQCYQWIKKETCRSNFFKKIFYLSIPKYEEIGYIIFHD